MAANIKAIDQAVIITSSLTNEELIKAQKYFPECLTVTKKDENDKVVPVFRVVIRKTDNGVVSPCGIEFPQGEKSENAAVTVDIPKMSKAKRLEFVKDNFGKVLSYLHAVEDAYAKANKEFDTAYKALETNICVE
jgi:hypothetical protein